MRVIMYITSSGKGQNSIAAGASNHFQSRRLIGQRVFSNMIGNRGALGRGWGLCYFFVDNQETDLYGPKGRPSLGKYMYSLDFRQDFSLP
jgi:hypothetical protein